MKQSEQQKAAKEFAELREGLVDKFGNVWKWCDKFGNGQFQKAAKNSII